MTQIKHLYNLRREIESYGGTVFFPEKVEQSLDEEEKRHIREEELIEEKNKSYFTVPDIDNYSFSQLMDSIVPACCSQGCMVEPDGYCEHGHPSILLHYGLI